MNKKMMTLFMLSFVLLLTGCGKVNHQAPVNELDWEDGQGNLPDQIEGADHKDVEAPPLLDHYYEDYIEIIERTGYDMPTGEWFIHDDEGELGYGLPSGTMEASSAYAIKLFAHREDGMQVERDIRIQLKAWDENFKQSELFMEDLIHVVTISGEEEIYSNQLPEKESMIYVLSVEFIDEQGQVEDTMVSMIYVPTPEINAGLAIDNKTYLSADEQVTITLQNNGPTFLTTGESYKIEKKVNNSWKVVPLDISFEDIGILINPCDSYKQTIDIDQLHLGEYRVIKTLYADGLDLSATLAVEFVVE